MSDFISNMFNVGQGVRVFRVFNLQYLFRLVKSTCLFLAVKFKRGGGEYNITVHNFE